MRLASIDCSVWREHGANNFDFLRLFDAHISLNMHCGGPLSKGGYLKLSCLMNKNQTSHITLHGLLRPNIEN